MQVPGPAFSKQKTSLSNYNNCVSTVVLSVLSSGISLCCHAFPLHGLFPQPPAVPPPWFTSLLLVSSIATPCQGPQVQTLCSRIKLYVCILSFWCIFVCDHEKTAYHPWACLFIGKMVSVIPTSGVGLNEIVHRKGLGPLVEMPLECEPQALRCSKQITMAGGIWEEKRGKTWCGSEAREAYLEPKIGRNNNWSSDCRPADLFLKVGTGCQGQGPVSPGANRAVRWRGGRSRAHC